MCQPEATQEPPDRNAVDGDAVVIRQFTHQIVQRQIGFPAHLRLDPALHGDQFPMSPAMALGARF